VEILGSLVDTAEACRVPIDASIYETLLFNHFQNHNFK
jgi:chaperone required for assembly of F1-ATPase